MIVAHLILELRIITTIAATIKRNWFQSLDLIVTAVNLIGHMKLKPVLSIDYARLPSPSQLALLLLFDIVFIG